MRRRRPPDGCFRPGQCRIARRKHAARASAPPASEVTRTRLTRGWGESPLGVDAASFAAVLRVARCTLPGGLIDGRGWERLAARAGELPVAAADAMFGFECRLDHGEAAADLLLSVPPAGRFADALVVDGAAPGPRAASLARLLCELRQPRSPLSPVVDLVALEYDVTGVVGTPAPGIFLRSTVESGYADARLLTAAIALGAGWNEEPCERYAVARVLAALPPGAAVRWAGAFPDRKERAVRLLIRALGDRAAAFLARIGWTGDRAAVGRIPARMRAVGVDNCVLALDVAAGRIVPRLGLELSRRGRTGASWRQALAMMTRNRWCLPEKAEALGLATRCERFFAPSGVSELHCGLHHVKLAVAGDERGGGTSGNGAVGAKGYVACVLRPLS